jgi:DNA polymerase III subunit epsilon
MSGWAAGELLGFDFETTGVDRFNDVPVSYALVHADDGVVDMSWSGLVDPGRDIPIGATEVHGISTERARSEGMPMDQAIGLVLDAVVSASRRGVPLVGMKLDYDLTILDTQAKLWLGYGLAERGWCGPVLDAVVIDRHFDRWRRGRRTLVALCDHYGVELGNAHDATADAVASLGVVSAMAARFGTLRLGALGELHAAQAHWHRQWARGYDVWRMTQGLIPIDPRDYVWPVAPASVYPAA